MSDDDFMLEDDEQVLLCHYFFNGLSLFCFGYYDRITILIMKTMKTKNLTLV
jgi:hypothetical protein